MVKAQVVGRLGYVLARTIIDLLLVGFSPNWGFPDNHGVHGLNVYFLIVIFISLEP